MSFTRTERAQLAMMLEVTAYPKPGNVDRCHDYPETTLEHFLASTILVRDAFERAERGAGGVGDLIRDAVSLSGRHSGGNTHFGAFILLVPLLMGGDIPGACRVTRETTVDDAVAFYEAFALTGVRVRDTDELDVHDPDVASRIRERGMTLFDIMVHSAANDMVAREWTGDFSRTRKAADLIKSGGRGRMSIVGAFLRLLAGEPDTFIVKKLGRKTAEQVSARAAEVLAGRCTPEEFDEECHRIGANPGSTADIIIAAIYTSLDEGWRWESCGKE